MDELSIRERYKKEMMIEKGQGSEAEMAREKRAREESVREVGMLLMIDLINKHKWQEFYHNSKWKKEIEDMWEEGGFGRGRDLGIYNGKKVRIVEET